MLDALRGQKAKKFVAWILVMMIGVPFIFYYGWGSSQAQRGPLESPVVAEVNGEPVYLDQLLRLRREIAMQLYGPDVLRMLSPDQLIQQLPDSMIVDEAVRNKLVAQTALASGLDMSQPERDDAVRRFTERYGAPEGAPPEQVTQVFAVIAQQLYGGYSPQQMYDHLMQEELRDRAARAIFFPQARTSILELWQAYEERRTQYVLDCAVFRVASRLATEEVTDADIENHYETNQEQYAVGEKRIYRYVAVRRSEQSGRLEVTDAGVQQAYEERIQDYTTPGVWHLDRIILQAVEGSDEPPAVAAEIEQRLASGEEFGELALEYSTDSTVQIDRGDIGPRREDQLDELVVDALRPLASGEVTAPIHLRTEWHIYRVQSVAAAAVRPFSEVSPEVRAALENRELDDLMAEREDEFVQAMSEYSSFEQVAGALNLTAATSDAVDPTSRYIPGLGTVPENLERDLAGLEVGEMMAEPIVTPELLAIVSLAEVQPRSVRPLDDSLRAEIRLRVAQQQAQEAAENEAYNVRQSALAGDREASGEFFRDSVVATGGSPDFEEVITEPFQPLNDEIEAVGQIEDLAQALHYSPLHHLSDVVPILSGEERAAGYVVWLVRQRVEPERSQFYTDLPEVRARVISENQTRLLEEWCADQQAGGQSTVVLHDLSRGAGQDTP